ncbi:MAG: hypothetical protein QM755_08220 [Luteolibacter sp.]
MISAILAAAALIVGWMVMKNMEKEKKTKALQSLIDTAADPAAKDLPVSASQLKSLLDSLKIPRQLAQYAPTMRAIRLAKATDSTNVDVKIAEFGTTADIPSDVRQMLFRDVVRRRDKRDGAPILIQYARSTKEASSADAALNGIKTVANDDDFKPLLETVESASTPQVRQSAADVAGDVARRSSNRAMLRGMVEQSLSGSVSDDVRGLLLGIKTAASGE